MERILVKKERMVEKDLRREKKKGHGLRKRMKENLRGSERDRYLERREL